MDFDVDLMVSHDPTSSRENDHLILSWQTLFSPIEDTYLEETLLWLSRGIYIPGRPIMQIIT